MILLYDQSGVVRYYGVALLQKLIHMIDKNLRFLPDNKVIKVDSIACTYCPAESNDYCKHTEDHVIGRKFVPRGSLDKSWNLIVPSCGSCNRLKGALEDDISAITMQPDVSGRFADHDSNLHQESLRKAKGAFSRRTKKCVAQSRESMSFSIPPIPGITFHFNFVTSPQIDDDRAYRLAVYQLCGFFHLITFNPEKRRGSMWSGCFAPIGVFSRLDWGNELLRGFAERTQEWSFRLHGIAAKGFFKIVIRQSPGTVELWAWALEWNKNYRIIGFCGDERGAEEVIATLPALKFDVIEDGKGAQLRCRVEQELPESEDTLFVGPDPSTGKE